MAERFGAGRGDYYGGSSRGRGTSWVSVVIGWLSALGASLILSGIIGAFVAAGAANGQGGNATLVRLLITLFFAFLIGSLRGVTLPGLPKNIVQQGLNASLTLSSVLALLLPFVAGALGGSRGAATGSRRPVNARAARGARYTFRIIYPRNTRRQPTRLPLVGRMCGVEGGRWEAST